MTLEQTCQQIVSQNLTQEQAYSQVFSSWDVAIPIALILVASLAGFLIVSFAAHLPQRSKKNAWWMLFIVTFFLGLIAFLVTMAGWMSPIVNEIIKILGK